MEANDDAGLCSCKEAGLVDPVDASTWLVSNGSVFVEQVSVKAVRHCLPVVIAGAVGPRASKINGLYIPAKELFNGKEIMILQNVNQHHSSSSFLRFNISGKWEVYHGLTCGHDLEFDECSTMALCQQTNIADPVSAISWQVLVSSSSLLQVQRAVTIERYVVRPQPILPLEILGVVGANANLLNGIYEATPESYNGKALLRNRAQPDIWLRYVTHDGANVWALSKTGDKDKNNTNGLASSVEKNLEDPALSTSSWQIYNSDNLELQTSVRVRRA
jgi:hypothetical protein